MSLFRSCGHGSSDAAPHTSSYFSCQMTAQSRVTVFSDALIAVSSASSRAKDDIEFVVKGRKNEMTYICKVRYVDQPACCCVCVFSIF